MNVVIALEKLKDDVLSFKLFFVICLAGASSLISWGVSKVAFDFAKGSTVFALLSTLASVVIFVPIAGTFLGSDAFTGAGRELILSCVSRKTYLLSRWIAASALMILGVVLSATIPMLFLNRIEFSPNTFFAILCLLLFSVLFVSASTCFSVLTNSTMASVVVTGIYTIAETSMGIIGYLWNKDLLYYLSPHALVIKGVLPEYNQIAVQATSALILLMYTGSLLWLACYYGERRDL